MCVERLCRVSMLGLVQSSHPLKERARLQKSCAKQLISLSSASQTVSKYNAQYHKLFQSVPKEEILMKGKSLLQPLQVLVSRKLTLCIYF